PTATTLSSSTGSGTATEALRPAGPYHLGALTPLSRSYGCLGGSGPGRLLRDAPSVCGACRESSISEDRRLKIQSTTAWSQRNILFLRKARLDHRRTVSIARPAGIELALPVSCLAANSKTARCPRVPDRDGQRGFTHRCKRLRPGLCLQ